MGKYEYWHIVAETGKNCPKSISVGKCITFPHIHDGFWVALFDETNETEISDTYKLVYLCRVNKDIPKDSVLASLRVKILEKGFENIAPWVKKERSK